MAKKKSSRKRSSKKKVTRNSQILYKYRNFESIEYALDIFVNGQLYAADFRTLNDPMEGRFVYSKGKLTKQELKRIRGKKSDYRNLSLSETETNMLMWSYYCSGHNGFVVGVELCEPTESVEKIEYVEKLKLDVSRDGDLAKSILSKKLSLWSHEKEHRVFSNREYVKVNVRELIFGIKTNHFQKEILTKIAEKFCPDISVRLLEKNDLETGDVESDEI